MCKIAQKLSTLLHISEKSRDIRDGRESKFVTRKTQESTSWRRKKWRKTPLERRFLHKTLAYIKKKQYLCSDF
jgi:hypothetical protein